MASDAVVRPDPLALGSHDHGRAALGRTANDWGITMARERGTIAGARITLNVNVHLDDAEV